MLFIKVLAILEILSNNYLKVFQKMKRKSVDEVGLRIINLNIWLHPY